MNFGFKLLIHKNLSYNAKKTAEEIFSRHFINTNGNYRCRRQSHAWWRRGILGLYVEECNMCVRRMSKNKRIFAAIPIDILEGKDGPIDFKTCVCAEHLGGTKVKLKEQFNENDYNVYYEIGLING